MLATEGVITRQRGKGTHVINNPRNPAPSIIPSQRKIFKLQADQSLKIAIQSPAGRKLLSDAFPGIEVIPVDVHSLRAPWHWEEHQDADLYLLTQYHLREYASNGLIVPWSDVAPSDELREVQTSKEPLLWTSLGDIGEPYLLPVSYSTLALFRNRHYLRDAELDMDAPFHTHDDFINAACRLRDNFQQRKKRGVHPFLADVSDLLRWPLFIYLHGGSLWSQDGKESLLNSETCRKGIHVYHELINNYRISSNTFSSERGFDRELFSRGKIAMHFGTFSATKYYGGYHDLEWDVIPIPGLDGTKTSLLLHSSLVCPAASKNQELVWRIARFLCGEEFQFHLAGTHLVIPAHSAVADQFAATEARGNDIATFRNSLSQVHGLEYPALFGAVTRLQQLIPLVWLDLPNANEHLNNIAAELTELLRSGNSSRQKVEAKDLR